MYRSGTSNPPVTLSPATYDPGVGMTYPDTEQRQADASVRARRDVLWRAVGCGALAIVLGAVVTYLALQTRTGQRLDDEAQRAVSGPPQTVRLILETLNWLSIGSVAVALLAALVWALVRRQVALAVGALVMVAGSITTTELLKFEILTRPDVGYGTNNSLPSGHTTVATSIALAGILVAPAVARTSLTVLGAVAATLVGAGTLVARWHRPADVVVALAVCAVWGALAVVLVEVTRRAPPLRAVRHRPGYLMALLGVGTVAVIVLMLGIRPTAGRYGLVPAVACLAAVGLASAACIGGFSRLADRLEP